MMSYKVKYNVLKNLRRLDNLQPFISLPLVLSPSDLWKAAAASTGDAATSTGGFHSGQGGTNELANLESRMATKSKINSTAPR